MNSLDKANALIQSLEERMGTNPALETDGPIYLGIDVGTANVVTIAVNADGVPLAGEITPARVVKEGLVVNYLQAVEIVKKQVLSLRQRLGTNFSIAASAIPPGTEKGNMKTTKNILESAELEVIGIIDEPTAASLVLGIDKGAVVDVGGGTTGISIIEDGKVLYFADEPTGGFQFDLVIAGHFGIPIEEAEVKKRDPEQQKDLLIIVRPVVEKISAIINQHLTGYEVGDLYLVGGTCSFPGFEKIIQDETKKRTHLPQTPMLVTPLGIALACKDGRSYLYNC